MIASNSCADDSRRQEWQCRFLFQFVAAEARDWNSWMQFTDRMSGTKLEIEARYGLTDCPDFGDWLAYVTVERLCSTYAR